MPLTKGRVSMRRTRHRDSDDMILAYTNLFSISARVSFKFRTLKTPQFVVS